MLLADRGYDADWIGRLSGSRACLQISRRTAIARSRSASARSFIAFVTWSNGSSTGSSNVSVSQLATQNLRAGPCSRSRLCRGQSLPFCAWITPTPYLSSNKLPEFSILHSGPNATRHVPRSVAGARHAHSIDFPRADAALVSEGEMDHSEPGPERRIRTFKHGADRN